MPLTLILAPDTAALVVGARGTVWQRLQRLARRATAPLRTFWQTLFTNVRRGLDVAAIEAALHSAHLLDAEQEAMAVWRAHAEDEARTFLPVILRDIVGRTDAIVRRVLVDDTGRAAAGQPDRVATQQDVNQYAQHQVTLITGTTLLGLRRLLRAGWLADMPAAPHAQLVHAGFGLTPQQIDSLTAARARWQHEGRSATQIQAATQQALTLGVARRVRAMAETQAYGTVNLAQRLSMTQAAQGTLGGGTHLRRYWHIQAGACTICRAVPGMNPQGVGLTEPFQTPNGPAMDAPLHVLCRCGADYRAPG